MHICSPAKPKLSATLGPSHSCLLLTFVAPQWLPSLYTMEISLSNGPFPSDEQHFQISSVIKEK